MTQKFIENNPDYWDKKMNLHPASIDAEFNRKDGMAYSTIKHVLKYVPKNGNKILDAGCGDGRYVFYLHYKGYRVEGCDFASERIKNAQHFSTRGMFQEGNVLQLPYKDDTFDTYLSVGVLHHLDIEEYDFFFNEMKRVLKRDSLVFCTVPRGDTLPSLYRKVKGKIKPQVYMRYFTLDECEELFDEQGLERLVSFQDRHNIVVVAKTR